MIVSETYNIDCMIGMKDYPDKYFGLACCDVPYGIEVSKMSFLKEKKTSVLQKNGTRINPHKNKKVSLHEDWDLLPPPQAYFDELRRVSEYQIIFGVDYTDWSGLGNGRIRWDKMIPEGMSFKRYETAYCSLFDHTLDLKLLWAGMADNTAGQ